MAEYNSTLSRKDIEEALEYGANYIVATHLFTDKFVELLI